MPSSVDLMILIQARDEASQVLNGVGGVMGTLATGALAAGAGIAAGLAVGIKSAGDLQQSVANISTIKPEIDTGAVFSQLNEISTRVPQSAKELADGVYNIFSSLDVSQEQAISLVETFSKAAVGAQTDTETFGTAAIGVMNAYGLSVDDASHISDVFFNTINKGVVTGPQLAAGLGLVTQSAKLAGVDLDSLGGFIAGVTKEGGDAAQNINNLSNLFQKITTAPAQKAFNDLGIATQDATGNFRPQIDVLADLKTATAGMTDAAKTAALQKIFPDLQARAGAAVILDQLGFVKDAIEENKASAGSAAAAYEKMSATFNSQSKLLGNTFQSILTTIGAQVLPAITPIVTAFAQSLPAAFDMASKAIGPFLQSAAGIGDQLKGAVSGGLDFITKGLQATGAAWAPWAAKAGPAGDAVGNTLSALSGVVQGLQFLLQGNFAAAWQTATAALGSFASPAALVAAGVKAIQDQFAAFAPTGERVGATFGVISAAITGVLGYGQELATQFADSGTAATTASQAMDILVAAVNGLSAGFESAVKFVQDNIVAQAALVGALSAAAVVVGLLAAGAAAHAIATTAVAVATGLWTAAQWLLNAALAANPIGIIIVVLAALAAGLIYAYENSEEFRAIVDAAFAAVVAAGKALLAFIQTLPGVFERVVAAVGDFFNELGTEAHDAVTAVGDAFSNLGSGISSALNSVGSTVGDFFNNLGTMVHDGLTAIADFFTSTWEAIPEDIRASLATVAALVGDKFSELGSLVSAGMAAVVSAVQAGWDAAASSVGAAISAIASAVSTGWDAITTAVGTAMSSVGTAVHAGWDDIVATVGPAVSGVAAAVQAAWDTVTTATATAWAAITGAIGTALTTALETVTGWVTDVLAAISGLAGEMGKVGSQAGQAVVDGLTGAITSGIKAVGDKAAEVARAALAAAKAALGASSPSKKFAELGVDIGDGLILGLDSIKDSVAKAMATTMTSAVSGLKAASGFLTVPQFGSAIKAMGFNSETISSICGPIAAQGISEGLGKGISLVDVEGIAEKIGAFVPGTGTLGASAFQRILSAIGIDSRTTGFQEAVDAAMKGIPVAISTPLHYFLAQGFDSATQQFVVGNTGTALKAGAEKMTRAAIEGVAGAATFIIPSLQAAGAAVRGLADDIATGFVNTATPAVEDLDTAITNLVGTNDLWQQLDTNASDTGKDLATYLGDIGAAGIDMSTASLEDLQKASGLTLPQIQDQAAAAGEDIRHWLGEVGVPSAQGLGDALQRLQDQGVPALANTSVSMLQLGRDIEASFTSAAPTAIDKFFGLLEGLSTAVDKEGADIATKLAGIATKVTDAVGKATADGAKQIVGIMQSAQGQLDSLGGSLANASSSTSQQSALESQIAAAKALHAQQRSDADALFAHDQDLAKASADLNANLAKAKSDLDKANLQQAYQDQVANLNTTYAQRVADQARTRGLDEADRAFAQEQDAKLTAFKQQQIVIDRDARILASQITTALTVSAAKDAADQERAVLAQSYADKLADLQAGLLSQLPGLTGEAATVVGGVLDQLATKAAEVTATINGSLGAIATSGGGATALLQTELPASFNVTDEAVETFADKWQVSWDDARATLEAGGNAVREQLGPNGKVPTSLQATATSARQTLGNGGIIPAAAKLTVDALGSVGAAAGDPLTKVFNMLKEGAQKLGTDGLAVAAKAAETLEGQFPGLTDAVNAWIATLGGIPKSISTDIITNFVTNGSPAGAGSGGGGGGGSSSSKNLGSTAGQPGSFTLPNIVTGGQITVQGKNLGDAINNAAKATGVSAQQQAGGGTFGNNTQSGLSFAVGGLVPGPVGAAIKATVHGGEYVLPANIVQSVTASLRAATSDATSTASAASTASSSAGQLSIDPSMLATAIRGVQSFASALALIPKTVTIALSAVINGFSDLQSVSTQIDGLPPMVDIPVSVDTGDSTATLEHLQDTFRAIPPAVHTMIGVDATAGLRTVDQVSAALRTVPTRRQIGLAVDNLGGRQLTAAASPTPARATPTISAQQFVARPTTAPVPKETPKSGDVHVHLTVEGSLVGYSEEKLAAVMREQMLKIGQRNGSIFGKFA